MVEKRRHERRNPTIVGWLGWDLPYLPEDPPAQAIRTGMPDSRRCSFASRTEYVP